YLPHVAYNARLHLLLEAAATQERRLEAVRCKPWFGLVPACLRFPRPMIPLRWLSLGALMRRLILWPDGNAPREHGFLMACPSRPVISSGPSCSRLRYIQPHSR